MKNYLVFKNKEKSNDMIPFGEKKLFQAGGKLICIARIQTGLVAFENACPHQGEGLSKGHINHLEEIICPLHIYRFSLKTGEEVANKCSGLKFINLLEIKGKIYLEV